PLDLDGYVVRVRRHVRERVFASRVGRRRSTVTGDTVEDSHFHRLHDAAGRILDDTLNRSSPTEALSSRRRGRDDERQQGSASRRNAPAPRDRIHTLLHARSGTPRRATSVCRRCERLQTGGGRCARGNAELEAVANSKHIAVDAKPGSNGNGGALVTTGYGVVEQSQRVADVAVILCGGVDGSRREAVRVVVVMDDDDVAVAIVAADVPPVQRARADQQREEAADRAGKETITDDAAPHPPRTVAVGRMVCQR